MNKPRIAIIVPTVRPEQFKQFLANWGTLIERHNAKLFKVEDGLHPNVNGLSVKDVMGKDSNLIYNFNDGVRNLGFAQAYKEGFEVFISLDDDTRPYMPLSTDTIQNHLDILGTFQPVSWINTSNEVFMRGFPYGIRNEAEVVLSHGVWEGVADFDASTQLVLGTPKLTYPRMVVPKGTLFPMCIMNVAFTRKAMPFMYQAPMFEDYNRFADIWAGIEAKKDIDAAGYAVVTGYATVYHERASNPFVNLIKEARGIQMNEQYGKDAYFKLFFDNRKKWKALLANFENNGN